MDVLIFILKILLMSALVGLMFYPIIAEHLSFRRDRENKVSHKRFRLFVFSVVYFIAITVVMVLLKDLILWIKSLNFVVWITNRVSLPSRYDYALAVFAVIIINFLIGVLFRFLVRLCKIGLNKKELVMPEGKNGEYTLRQRLERAVLKYFNDEKWFFAGRILKCLCISLTAVYALVFLLYQIPIFWGANWIPYNFILSLFGSGYIYPLITLIPLWEAYFFLAGVELLVKECPQFDSVTGGSFIGFEPDLQAVNEECKKLFKDHFAYQIEGCIVDEELASTSHHEITKLIAAGIESDERNPRVIKESYLKCLDIIVENDVRSTCGDCEEKTSGILINGSFFSEFSAYFMRYMSVILSRGDNIIFVCNNDTQIEQTYSYVTQALEQIYSLFHSESKKSDIDFNHPIWKIYKVSEYCSDIECSDINNCSVLITDWNFLTSQRFEKRCTEFIYLTDTVIMVDALASANSFARQMSIFDANMKNSRMTNAIRAKNSSGNGTGKARSNNKAFMVRYMSSQIKYIGFDDSRIPGLDKVMKNLLFVDFFSADAMKYNPKTIVACYNYEGRPNENGERERIQSARTEEDLGVLVNMADFAVGFGSGKVSLFAEQHTPFEDFSESVAANENNGLRVKEGVNLSINCHHYNFEDYRVIVAFDHDDNLPMAIRSYLAMSSDKPLLIMLFSRPYMFRDYYLENIEELWKPDQLMRIPVEQSGRQSAIQKILVKANSGGIAISEIFDILTDAHLDDYAEAIRNNDINDVLRRILSECNKHSTETLHWKDYFEFVKFNSFNNSGVFVAEDRIHLRKTGMLFELLKGSVFAKIVIDGKESALPLPKDRLTQNYIVGQNMLYNGGVYTINNIDTASGRLFIKRATGGRNTVPYQYIQDREYHIDFSQADIERVYATKHVVLNTTGDFAVDEVKISVTRRPMEVITNGYTPIDHRTMSMNGADSNGYVSISGSEHISEFRQTYRKYGEVKNPVCTSDMIMKGEQDINASPNGALVMSVKLSGEFGEDTRRISTLASVMVGELLKAMFPSVADAIAVCPVVSKAFDDDESKDILGKQPKVFCRDYESNDKDIELLIIEDCLSDIGVISVLMSSGDDVVKMLFSPINKYLQWYANQNEKSKYLYFGKEKEPACFDFAGMGKLASILGKEDFKLRFVDVETITQNDVCDFCGKRYPKGTDVVYLEDGRKMCKDCASSLVGNDKKVLKAHLERARIFLESTYGIALDSDYEFCFESTVKIVNTLKQNNVLTSRGSDLPLKSYIDDKKKVHVEYSIPSVNLSELLVRELTHVWQLKNLPDLAEDYAEGHISLVGIQYLRFLNQPSLASVRATYYESNGGVSGEGYRKLVRELLAKPQYNNNPFRYLLEASGVPIEDEIIPPKPRVIESGAFGLPYTPEHPDRALDGNINYFYYSRLTATQQKGYDTMLTAIRNHAESATAEGCSFSDITTIHEAITFDHPELFWYKICSSCGSDVSLEYGCTAEEAAVLQRRIDEVVPQYLEGIDDSMSAYDVALRLHVKVISSVDYDTIALNRETEAGGPSMDSIDYLRTICGVFLDGKAVCEGYARAMQYLLQKCGVECAEAAGMTRNENGASGGGHAWNIIKIDGDYYYLDTTWDDSSDTVQTVKSDDPGFDYFCVTTDELTRTRDIDLCPTDVPNCNAIRANYFYHNDLVLDSYDLNKIKTIAQTAAKNKASFFVFKCKSRSLYDQAFSALCSSGDDCFNILKSAAKVDKSIVTNSYSCSYDKNIWTITIRFKYK